MAERILLSIIVPIYNCAPYLSKYLDSVLSAGLERWELLLIDDGSTDTSGEICRCYAAQYSFVRYIRQQNEGPSAARNRGFEEAKGEYVAFHDGDDIVDGPSFAKTVGQLEIESAADIWVSDFCRIADNGVVLDRVYQIEPSDKPLFGEAIRRTFFSSDDCIWNVWRYIFRREYLLSKGICFAENCRCGEDMVFVTCAVTATEEIAFFHNPYYAYRVNYGNSLTRQYTVARARETLWALRTVRDQLQTVNTREGQALRAIPGREYIRNLPLYVQVGKGNRAEVLSLLQEEQELMHNVAGLYQIASWAIRLLGIRASAWLLYAAKKMKQGVRSYRQHKRKERVGDHTGL